MDGPRTSKLADALMRSRIERARARTPEERILLALALGARGRLLREAGRAAIAKEPSAQ